MSDNEQLIADFQSDNDAMIKKLDEMDKRLADWKSDYDTLLSKLYQKDEEIAELERQKALLRAVAISAKSLFNENSYLPLSEWHLKLMNATQAAIDGGALDKDGEK